MRINKKSDILKIKNSKLIKGMRIIIIIALAILFFYPPYLQGLFFEQHILPTGIFIFFVFLLFWIYKLIIKDYYIFKTPLEYAVFGFVIIYLISFFVAVHKRTAFIECLKYCMYFAVFYMISELIDNDITQSVFLWTIVGSAVGVSIIGLDSAIGGNIVRFLNKIFYFFGVEGNLFFGLFVDNRINSTLQYPNALASYLLAVFFITIGFLLMNKDWWKRLLIALSSFILFLTFILTQSRGVYLLFPALIITYLFTITKGKRIKAATQIALITLPALLVAIFISPYLSSDKLNNKAIIILSVGLVIVGATGSAAIYIGEYLEKINIKTYIAIIAPVCILLICSIFIVVNSSIPVELIHTSDEDSGLKMVSHDVKLIPGKDYILCYDADVIVNEKQTYAYYTEILTLSKSDIIFGRDKKVLLQYFNEGSGKHQEKLSFTTPADSDLIRINFVNYFSGTGVTIDNVKFIDPVSGKTAKKVILKNKYGLERFLTRVKNLSSQQSFLIRNIYYLDGLKIFKQNWLLGGGGGTWDFLYRQFQSYNYPSSQAHNYPLQLGIETGLIGILVLATLVAYIIIGYYKLIKKIHDDEKQVYSISSIAIAATTLFVHSAFDFNFSEAAIFLLFWQLLSILNRKMRDYQVYKVFSVNGLSKSNAGSKFRISHVIVGVIIIFLIINCMKLTIASNFANKAYKQLVSNNIDKAITYMNNAIKLDKLNEKYIIGYSPLPSRPDIKVGLTDLVLIKSDLVDYKIANGEQVPNSELQFLQQQFTSANNYVVGIEGKAKNNINLTSNLASYYFSIGETEKGIYYLNELLQLYPFEPSLWQSKVNLHYQLMSQYINNGDYERARENLDIGLNVIDEVLEVNQRNMNPFILTSETVELLQKMQYIKDKWNTLNINNVNDLVLYTIPKLDVNFDNIPDQWNNRDDFITLSLTNEGIDIKASNTGLIYTQYPLTFEKGKDYAIEVELYKPVKALYYTIPNIINEVTGFMQDENIYRSSFHIDDNIVNNEATELRIYFSENCIINSVTVAEKN